MIKVDERLQSINAVSLTNKLGSGKQMENWKKIPLEASRHWQRTVYLHFLKAVFVT